MGSRIYNKFIDLLQRWPIDKSRTGRDLGERLRTLVAQEFPQGPISKVNEGKLNKDWESLNRIANNEYRDRFPRKFAGSTVLDWELDALKLATSNEGLDTINNEYQKRKKKKKRTKTTNKKTKNKNKKRKEKMLQRKFILALSSRLGQYRYLSTQDFISQNDAEFTTKTSIPHTPIFSRNLMEFFRQRQEGPDKHFKILDMTFGSGGHTCYILDQFKRYGVQGSIIVYASDCDTESYNVARRLMSERDYDVKELVPIRSSFKNLEEKLIEKGVEPGTLSGILIDTGVSTIQWANQQRGFCHLRDGILDLRLDPFQNTPKGYEVLQNIEEDSLLKLLRRYGSLKTNAQHIANAILEARFMQYEFKTVHELTEIMESAVKHATKTPHSDTADPEMVSEFVQKTITALRIFVNDELNQLDYAIRYLAAKYLKNTGILAVIAHNEVEKKVVHRCLKQISLDDMEDTNEVLSTQEIEHIQHQNPWKIIQGEPPLPLPMAEQILYPRFKNAVLFAAQRVV